VSRPNRDVSCAIALPPDWQQIDLLDPEGEPVLDGPLAAALAHAAHGTDHAQLLMLRSLFALTANGQPLAAGLAVTLADPSAPVSSQPLTEETFAGREVAAVTLPAGSGLRVRHIAPAGVLGGSEPLQVLRIQYLLHTVHGLLTVTFTTPQAPRAPEWNSLFDAMAATCELA
jgi:hypothetical protein